MIANILRTTENVLTRITLGDSVNMNTDGEQVNEAVMRFLENDWGETCLFDCVENEEFPMIAVGHYGAFIVSSYPQKGARVVIVSKRKVG